MLCDRRKNLGWHGVAVLCAVLAPFPSAAEDDGLGDEIGAHAWRPSLHASGFYTDNFYNENSATESSSGAVIRPRLGYKAEGGRLAVDSSIAAELGMFDVPGNAGDYVDGDADARLDWNAGTRNHFHLTGEFSHAHDPFGVNRTEDATVRDADLDRYNRLRGSLGYRFGAAGATINTELQIFGQDKRYVTNRAATQVLGYDNLGFEYALYYRYTPKTSFLIDVGRTDYRFDEPLAATETRDGTLHSIRLGARWQATAKTAGDVRLGVRRRSFDNGAEPLEGLDWRATVSWAARPKTLLELRTLRSEQESYLATARVIDLKAITLGWKQVLTPRLRSTVSVGNIRASFFGADRQDDILSGSVDLDYLLRRYLYLTAAVNYLSRDSSALNRDYDRLNGYIGFRLGR